jgi:DNA-directed RNA polymerase subunit M/transcription elongation factor TFIIS
MPTRRERRSAELKCQDCGYEFAASVPHVVHTVEDSPQPVSVAVDRIDVNCPNCGSRC